MRFSTFVWMITFVIVLGSVTTLLKTVDRTLFSWGRPKQQQVTTTPPSTMPPVRSSGATAAQPIPPATTPRDQHWEAMKLLTEASVAHQDALDEIDRWHQEIEPLRNEPTGDAVAAKKDLVTRLTYVFDKKRMSQDELHVLGEQIDLMQKRLEGVATSDDPELLSPREMYDIRELHTKATVASRAWQSAVEQANAIVVKATLAAQSASTLEKEMEKIRAEKTISRLDEEIESGVSTASATEPSTEAEFSAELRKKALSPEVSNVLAPLFTSRKVSFRRAGLRIDVKPAFNEQPVSLSMLRTIGALDQSMQGLAILGKIGGHPRLSEPRWSINWHPTSWSSSDQEFMTKAQAMLIEYGDIFVAEGLLAP